MKKLKWLEENFEGVIFVIFLTLLTTLVTLQIIMRYLFHSPFSWSEELCRMLLVWSGFFSIGYCARKGSTIRLDTVLTMLPPLVQRILLNFTTVFMVGLLMYLFAGAFRLVMDTASDGSMLPGLQIPQYWLYAVPMAGLALGAVRFAQVLVLTKFFCDAGKKGASE